MLHPAEIRSLRARQSAICSRYQRPMLWGFLEIRHRVDTLINSYLFFFYQGFLMSFVYFYLTHTPYVVSSNSRIGNNSSTYFIKSIFPKVIKIYGGSEGWRENVGVELWIYFIPSKLLWYKMFPDCSDTAYFMYTCNQINRFSFIHSVVIHSRNVYL